jgi:hypothetical protein
LAAIGNARIRKQRRRLRDDVRLVELPLLSFSYRSQADSRPRA